MIMSTTNLIPTMCAIAVISMLAAGCDTPTNASCELDVIESLLGDDYVIIDVQSGDLSSTANPGSVTISGSLSSEVRIERLEVGTALAQGLTANFTTWSVELSQAQLQAARDGEFAYLNVAATDVCGVEHTVEALEVRVDAPSGSPAPGLSITVTPSTPGECYVPIDGSGAAQVLVEADGSAAGVRVGLAAIIDGEFLGVDTGGVRLQPNTTEQTLAPPVSFRAKAAGKLGISAAAGPTYVIDNSGLAAVAAPIFTGASGSVTPGVALVVRPRTNGRLARCWAAASSPSLVSVSGEGADLLLEDVVFDQPDCGQEAVLNVEFDLAAPAGTKLELWCADSYGQIGMHTLDVQG